MHLKNQQTEFISKFELWLSVYLHSCAQNSFYAADLLKSQSYSLLSGGKRFRPFLAFLVFHLFSDDENKIKNLALSLEMIHTYSLIHDDLPCMDNDDFRRGKPTNHKVFSEDLSLLAGDGLLSDVFAMLAGDIHLTASAKVSIIKLLSEKIGSAGMVAGQVLDMQARAGISYEELKKIHTLKTANLIQCAAVSAALAADCTEAQLHLITEFSYHLGMAFQIKDDLLDHNSIEQDFKSYVSVLGMEKSINELKSHSELAEQNLQLLKKPYTALNELIQFNLMRNS
jgi:geranylgeranyl diphosphate synthase, type II